MFRQFTGYQKLALMLLSIVLGTAFISIFSSSDKRFGRLDYLSEIKSDNTTSDLNAALAAYEKPSGDTTTFQGQREEGGKLDVFFRCLDTLNKDGGRYHVAYFGDSQIEGDLLTQGLRGRLQKKFGGNGIGWMPITSIVAGFRVTINHGFNDLWRITDFLSYHKKQPFPVGPTGQVFGGSPGARCSFTARSYPFEEAHLIAHPNSKGKILCSFDDAEIHFLWPDSLRPNFTKNIWDKPFKKMTLTVEDGNPQLYGINFEKGDGIYVDNFGFRGNSGNSLSLLNINMMQSVDSAIRMPLVIVHYGLNVIGHGVDDYRNYEITMGRTLEHLKKCFPNSSILLVGMTDKAYKEKGKWDTDPTVLHLLRSQKKIADEHGVAFFSLFDAMGGVGSMRSWVQDSIPKLANTDYTHMTHKGSDYLAQFIYQYLQDSYAHYLENKK
jgi:lysophospholipase L1-like esterase